MINSWLKLNLILVIIVAICQEEIGLNEELIIAISFLSVAYFLYLNIKDGLSETLQAKKEAQADSIRQTVIKGQKKYNNLKIFLLMSQSIEQIFELKTKEEITNIKQQEKEVIHVYKVQVENKINSLLTNILENTVDSLNTTKIYNDGLTLSKQANKSKNSKWNINIS